MKNKKQINQLTYEERMFYYTHKHKGITSKQVWVNYWDSKDTKSGILTTFEEHFSVYWWFLNRMKKAGAKWYMNKEGCPVFYNIKSLNIYNKCFDPKSALVSASILAKKIIETGEEFGYLKFLEKFKYEISIFKNTTIYLQEKDIKAICQKLEIKKHNLWKLNEEQIELCKDIKFQSPFFKKHRLTKWSLYRIKRMRFSTIEVDNLYLDNKYKKSTKTHTKIKDIIEEYVIENDIKIKKDKTNHLLLSVFRKLWIWNDYIFSLDETPKNIKDKGFEVVGKHYNIYGENKIFTSRWPALHRFARVYRKLEPKTPIEKKETFLQYLKRKLFGGGKV